MTTQTANKRNKSDLSDLSSIHKVKISDLNNNNISDPLTLFRNLSIKGTNPIYPTNTPTDTPAPIPPPATEPTFTPAQVRFFADFYCSRPRPERLAMHRRSLYLRADRGWPWDICETQKKFTYILSGSSSVCR